MQVEAEAELLAALHVGDVSLLRWNIRGTQLLGECSSGWIPRQEQRYQVVEEQENREDRNYAE
jgi:hypothetical protein